MQKNINNKSIKVRKIDPLGKPFHLNKQFQIQHHLERDYDEMFNEYEKNERSLAFRSDLSKFLKVFFNLGEFQASDLSKIVSLIYQFILKDLDRLQDYIVLKPGEDECLFKDKFLQFFDCVIDNLDKLYIHESLIPISSLLEKNKYYAARKLLENSAILLPDDRIEYIRDYIIAKKSDGLKELLSNLKHLHVLLSEIHESDLKISGKTLIVKINDLLNLLPNKIIKFLELTKSWLDKYEVEGPLAKKMITVCSDGYTWNINDKNKPLFLAEKDCWNKENQESQLNNLKVEILPKENIFVSLGKIERYIMKSTFYNKSYDFIGCKNINVLIDVNALDKCNFYNKFSTIQSIKLQTVFIKKYPCFIRTCLIKDLNQNQLLIVEHLKEFKSNEKNAYSMIPEGKMFSTQFIIGNEKAVTNYMTYSGKVSIEELCTVRKKLNIFTKYNQILVGTDDQGDVIINTNQIQLTLKKDIFIEKEAKYTCNNRKNAKKKDTDNFNLFYDKNPMVLFDTDDKNVHKTKSCKKDKIDNDFFIKKGKKSKKYEDIEEFNSETKWKNFYGTVNDQIKKCPSKYNSVFVKFYIIDISDHMENEHNQSCEQNNFASKIIQCISELKPHNKICSIEKTDLDAINYIEDKEYNTNLLTNFFSSIELYCKYSTYQDSFFPMMQEEKKLMTQEEKEFKYLEMQNEFMERMHIENDDIEIAIECIGQKCDLNENYLMKKRRDMKNDNTEILQNIREYNHMVIQNEFIYGNSYDAEMSQNERGYDYMMMQDEFIYRNSYEAEILQNEREYEFIYGNNSHL